QDSSGFVTMCQLFLEQPDEILSLAILHYLNQKLVFGLIRIFEDAILSQRSDLSHFAEKSAAMPGPVEGDERSGFHHPGEGNQKEEESRNQSYLLARRYGRPWISCYPGHDT